MSFFWQEVRVMPMSDLVSESVAPSQVSMVLLTILGMVALLLSLGIYGVLSFQSCPHARRYKVAPLTALRNE